MTIMVKDRLVEQRRPSGPPGGARFTIRRPFVSVWVAASVLNCSEHRISGWIQDGRLPFAFDIARPDASRACVRLSTAALWRFRSRTPPYPGLPEFLDATFPADKPAYQPGEVAWMMQCDSNHIYNLIHWKVLAGVARRPYEIPRQSLVCFLTERVLP